MDRNIRGLENFRATTREECGILIEDAKGLKVIACNNAADNDEDYSITYGEYQKIENELGPGEKIVGFFHTHLPQHSKEPSDWDFDGAELQPLFLHLIYKPDTNELCWYGVSDEVMNGT